MEADDAGPCGEDLGFYPQESGSPGGLWAEDGHHVAQLTLQ